MTHTLKNNSNIVGASVRFVLVCDADSNTAPKTGVKPHSFVGAVVVYVLQFVYQQYTHTCTNPKNRIRTHAHTHTERVRRNFWTARSVQNNKINIRCVRSGFLANTRRIVGAARSAKRITRKTGRAQHVNIIAHASCVAGRVLMRRETRRRCRRKHAH